MGRGLRHNDTMKHRGTEDTLYPRVLSSSTSPSLIRTSPLIEAIPTQLPLLACWLAIIGRGHEMTHTHRRTHEHTKEEERDIHSHYVFSLPRSPLGAGTK